MKYIITLLIISCIGSSSIAQNSFKENHNFDLALSVGSSEFNGSLAWNQTHGIFKGGKFKLGYGLRFNAYSGSNKDYTTAPAELTSNTTGPGVFFSETFYENIDTFRVASAQHNSLNAAIYIEYDFNEKWGLGFNIDAIGIGFGSTVDGTMISSFSTPNDNLTQEAKPTSFNLLLISDNDIGMLNSELYAKYQHTEKLGFRLGFNFEFTEYTTSNTIPYNFDNDRFRYKSLMGMIAINYKPFK